MVDEDKIEDEPIGAEEENQDGQTDDKGEPSGEDESAPNPFENRVSVSAHAKLRRRAQDAEARADAAEAKAQHEELPAESPLEVWAKENPDEDQAPLAVHSAESRYWRKVDQQERSKERTEDRKQRDTETSQAREADVQAALTAGDTDFYWTACQKRLNEDQYEQFKTACAGKSASDIAALAREYGTWAIENQGLDHEKATLAHLRKTSKSPSKKKPDTPGPGDDELDYTAFDAESHKEFHAKHGGIHSFG